MRNLFLLLFTLLLCTRVSAQTTKQRAGKRAKQRVEQRANNKLDRKIDEGVDKAFGAVEGLFKKRGKDKPVEEGGLRANDGEAYQSDEEATQAFLNALGGGDAEPHEPYTNETQFSLDMVVTTTKRNGKKESHAMQLGASEDQLAMVFRAGDESNRMLYSTLTGKTTVITTDKRGKTQAFRMRMPRIGATMAEDMAADMQDRFEIERTGQRKVIEGYDCELFIIRDPEEGTVTESWVTEDIDLSAQEALGSMAVIVGGGKNQFQQADAVPTDYPIDAFPIMATVRGGKTVTEMVYKNIRVGAARVDRSLFDTSGITVQDMPGFGG